MRGFIDDKLNAMLDAVASATDPAARLDDVRQAQEYILDQAYDVPVFEEPQVFAGAPYTRGIRFEAVGRPSFYGTWLAKH